jgi:hypothetical protein
MFELYELWHPVNNCRWDIVLVIKKTDKGYYVMGLDSEPGNAYWVRNLNLLKKIDLNDLYKKGMEDYNKEVEE